MFSRASSWPIRGSPSQADDRGRGQSPHPIERIRGQTPHKTKEGPGRGKFPHPIQRIIGDGDGDNPRFQSNGSSGTGTGTIPASNSTAHPERIFFVPPRRKCARIHRTFWVISSMMLCYSIWKMRFAQQKSMDGKTPG
uniref:Uncharacterized protein n=1 Tax=Globodera rostochiensis TaxID=31243 RepID=A0A914GTQ5_GLORO